jgi:signal peptidase I
MVAAVIPVVVRGDSMEPTLRDGDRVVVRRLGRAPRRGEIVLVPDPRAPERSLIKRIAAVRADGLALAGDRPERSTDSRTFGPVDPRSVEGQVVFRYGPLRRVGRVR